MNKFQRRMLNITCLTTAMTSVAAYAQSSQGADPAAARDDRALEEITVTARKQTESLMGVPVAVTAISAAQLQRAATTDLAAISQLAPQVVVGRSDSGTGASFTIRGIGTPFYDAGADQSVSVNIDGIAAGRGNIITQGFFDLEQVEVMKGPQALFFGKNSPAGVISLHSASPGNKVEGYARAGYEFEAHERYAEAAVGGPISDTLKGRIAVRGSKMRGWIINTATPVSPNPFFGGGSTPGAAEKGNGGEDLLGRITLVYQPTDAFTAMLKVSGGIHKDNGTTGQTVCDPSGGLSKPTLLGLTDQSGDCEYNKFNQHSALNPGIVTNWDIARDGRPYTDTWSTLSSLTMDYDFGDLTLTSVTGFFKLKHRQALDFTYSSFGQIYVALGENTRQWSQELRLVSDFDGPLNFTVGGYWEDGKRSNPTNALLFLSPDAATGKNHTYESVGNVDSQTLSAFGQMRWQIVDQVELAGGVRYSKDKKDAVIGNLYRNPGAIGFLRPAGDFILGRFRDSNWSPEVTLSWKPNNETLIFGAFKTGYKSGGFANPSLIVATQTLADVSYGSETIKGFELGVKSELFDRTTRIELTAYSYKYNNLQVSYFDQSVFQYKMFNAPTSRIKGAELAGQWRPVNGLTLKAAAAYNNAKFTNFPSFPCYTYQTRATGCTIGGIEATPGGIVVAGSQNQNGKRLARAPRWALNFGFDYEGSLGNGLGFGLNADTSYSSQYDAAEDRAPILRQKGYALLNAGARVFSEGSGWELAFIGRNLTNKYYMFAGSGKSNAKPEEYIIYTPRTRELRVQATYRF